ncbi:bifunctional metallophosphatase/5'-nucleotidase [Streptococcus hyointestinalis]|uniref:bifunctional metallophosphatase/5'-nucleotidase n=1 Tax=Streptococcus hyointestinalis TaxID=1337 RepID=UPI003D0616AD
MSEHIRLLHINDLHSHFEAYPKIKRFFEEKRSSEQVETLTLDLGDNIDRSHPLTDATLGRANVSLMNDLGIQLATIGNNEGIGLSKDVLNHVYDTAQFQLILGNLESQGQRPSWAQPYHLYKTKKSTTIAFLAYTFPYTATYEPNGWQVLDPLACLAQDLERPEVKAADFRIVMSHLGIRYDEKIAESFGAVDLIIGAHTHHVFEEGKQLGTTYLAAAGKYGQYVGEINLFFDDHKLEDIDITAHETRCLSSQTGDNAFVSHLEDEGHRLLQKYPIKTFTEDFDLEKSCQLVMAAMLDYAKADVVIINSGLVVTPFVKELSRDSLQKSLPHQMRLAVVEIDKAALLEICQDIYSEALFLKNEKIRGMGFRGRVFGDIVQKGFTYKNHEIVYNSHIAKKEKLRLVLVDQYVFARYFEALKAYPAQLLFPDLLREVIEKYIVKTF